MKMVTGNRTIEVSISSGSIMLAVRDADNRGPVVALSVPEAKALAAALVEYTRQK